jgi:protein gp37
MGETTIPWCDFTHNEWLGCEKVGPECKHCYAEAWGRRFGIQWGPHGERRLTSEANRRRPYAWNRQAVQDGVRRRVFCSSLSDVFEDRPELVPWRKSLMVTIAECDSLDWLLLSKRPQNILGMVTPHWLEHWPHHVQVGGSGGTQRTVDEMAVEVGRVPAPVRFLSAEPLLERIDVREHLRRGRLSWVITGSESGAYARPMDEDWARDLRDQCVAFGVPFFYKQRIDGKRRVELPVLDGRQWAEYPEVRRD